MTDKEFTDEEIEKALEICNKCITIGSIDECCPECPLSNYDGCCDKLIVELADFFNRQKEELEECRATIGLMKKRPFYNRFVKEVMKDVVYPDFDYVYQLYFEQKEEIERYEKTVGKLAVKDGKVIGLLNGKQTEYIPKKVAETFKNMAIKNAKSEAIKEFAERLKKIYSKQYTTALWKPLCDDIDNLVKEMESDNNV